MKRDKRESEVRGKKKIAQRNEKERRARKIIEEKVIAKRDEREEIKKQKVTMNMDNRERQGMRNK